MKKLLNKGLSFVLTIIFIAACIPGVIAAEDDYVPNTEVAIEAEKLFAALGINLPPSSDYSAQVTRGDFLAALIQLYSNSIAPSTAASHGFADVPAASPINSALSYALNVGIVSPAENFEPDRNVTYIEAFKMSVVLIGYAMEAQQNGGYPVGYQLVAQTSGLSKGISYSPFQELRYADLCILLKNALEVDIRKTVAIGSQYEYEQAKGKNILTEYFDLKEVIGVVSANENTFLHDPALKMPKGRVLIGSTQYKMADSAPLGSCIKAWATTDSVENEIVFFTIYRTNSIVIEPSDFISCGSRNIKHQNSRGSEMTASLSVELAVIYNGKAHLAFENTDFDIETGNLLLIDNNADGQYDVVHINESKPTYISSVDANNKILFDKNEHMGFDLSLPDMNYTVTINGVPSDIRNITADSIADLYISKDGLLVSVSVSKKSVSGTISSYSTADKTIYLDEKPYRYTEYFSKYYLESITPGNSISLLLSEGGLIVASTKLSSSMQYGYLVGIKPTANYVDGESLADMQVKMFTREGKVSIYLLAPRVIIDNQAPMAAYDVPKKANALKVDQFNENSLEIKEQLVRYMLNNDGEISVIDTEYCADDYLKADFTPTMGFVDPIADDRDCLRMYNFSGYNTTTQVAYKTTGLMVHRFFLSASTPVMQIAGDVKLEDSKRFAIKDRSIFPNDDKNNANLLRPYNVDYSGVADIMIFLSAASSTLPSEPKNGLVESYNASITPEGETCHKLVIFTQSNMFETYYVTDYSIFDESNVRKAKPAPGDYIRFAYSTNNEITAYEKDFSYSSRTLHHPISENVLLSYYYGQVYSKTGTSYMIKNAASNWTDGNFMCFTCSNNIAIFDTKTNKVSPGTPNDIIAYLQDNNLYSTILMRNRYAAGTNMVIYK